MKNLRTTISTRHVLSLALGMAIAFLSAPCKAQDWNLLGTAGFSSGSSLYQDLALDANNVPYVVYRDLGLSARASVMKYNGTAWVPVGTAASVGTADFTSIAINASGTPYISFRDVNQGGRVVVRKFDGTAWTSVGTPVSTTSANYTSITFSANDTPFVAFSELGTVQKVIVKKFDGTAWVQVGGSASVDTADNVALALDGNGIPYVAYRDLVQDQKTTVRKYDGIDWVTVGTPGFTTSGGVRQTIAVDGNNIPYVAATALGTGNLEVMKFDGNSWVDVGTATPLAGLYASFAFDPFNNVYLGYIDIPSSVKPNVKKLVGDNWEQVGTPGFAASTSGSYTSLAIGSNGRIFLVYREGATAGNKTTVNYLDLNSSVPHFQSGAPASLSFCAGASAQPLDSLLKAFDGDTAQTLTWTILKPPTHGSLNGFPAMASANSSNAVPTAVYYQPEAMYAGADTCSIIVSDGFSADTLEVYTNVLPLPTISAGADQEVCPGSAATLNGSGAVSYTWNNFAHNGVPFFPTAPSMTYTVTGTDANGCTNTDQVVVSLHLPQLSPSGFVNVCKGTTTTITAPAGAATYTWKKNGVKVGGKTNTLTVSAAGTYTVTYLDPLCGNTITPSSVSVNVVTPPSKPVVTPASVKICDGETATLSAPAGFDYQWYDQANVAIPGATGQDYVSNASVTVRLATSTLGCASVKSNPAKIVVNPLPLGTFYVKKVNKNGSLILTAHQTNATYVWYLNGSPIPGANSINLTATQSGVYKLEVTKKGTLCVATSADTSITVNYTGVREAQSYPGLEEETEELITVYPNPSTGIFRIQSEEPMKAVVRDIQGRVVAQKDDATEIDLSAQTNGIYLLQLFNKQNEPVKTIRLNKQ